jgi:hypothetical protein
LSSSERQDSSTLGRVWTSCTFPLLTTAAVVQREEQAFASFDGGRVRLSIQRTVTVVHLVGLDTAGVGSAAQSRGMFVSLNPNQYTPVLEWVGSISC